MQTQTFSKINLRIGCINTVYISCHDYDIICRCNAVFLERHRVVIFILLLSWLLLYIRLPSDCTIMCWYLYGYHSRNHIYILYIYIAYVIYDLYHMPRANHIIYSVITCMALGCEIAFYISHVWFAMMIPITLVMTCNVCIGLFCLLIVAEITVVFWGDYQVHSLLGNATSIRLYIKWWRWVDSIHSTQFENFA